MAPRNTQRERGKPEVLRTHTHTDWTHVGCPTHCATAETAERLPTTIEMYLNKCIYVCIQVYVLAKDGGVYVMGKASVSVIRIKKHRHTKL